MVIPLLGVTLAPALALAQVERNARSADQFPVEPTPGFVAAGYIDTQARSRAHLDSEYSLGDTTAVGTFEIGFNLNLLSWLGVSAQVPFGLAVPGGADSSQFFVGNVGLGLEGGTELALTSDWEGVGRPSLRLGAAFDVYAPTAPRPERGCGGEATCDPAAAVLSARALNPALYVSDAVPFRVRGHVGVTYGIFAAGLDLGVTPAFALRGVDGADPFLFLTLGGRVSALPHRTVEPFVEVAKTFLVREPIAGRYDTAPLMVTPGVRLHIGSMSPAIFASIPVGDANGLGLTFGVDLAGIALRSLRYGEAGEGTAEFIDTPDPRSPN